MSVTAESMRSSSLLTVSENQIKTITPEKERVQCPAKTVCRKKKVFFQCLSCRQTSCQWTYCSCCLLRCVQTGQYVPLYVGKNTQAVQRYDWPGPPKRGRRHVTPMPGRGDCKRACRLESAAEEGPQRGPASEIEEPTSFTQFSARSEAQ